jgi:hypothetical protein
MTEKIKIFEKNEKKVLTIAVLSDRISLVADEKRQNK